MSYYLGIDGGGTKTTCAVGDETQLLAAATSGPSNLVRVGELQARESIHESVRRACTAAGIVPAQVNHTCIGAAGAARPEFATIVHRILAEIISTPIEVVGDIQISLEAAFDLGPGVIVIGGTGSIAYGRNPHGVTARAGGWGFAISDEGSAHWIGRAAVAAILRADDAAGGTLVARTELYHSPAIAAVLKAWGVTSFPDLARAANAIPPPDFARLFPAICSGEKDFFAPALADAGRELAGLAAVVIRRLFAQPDITSVPVAMIGGVFRHAALVREIFYNELRQADPRIDINPNVVDPVEGALRMARRAGQRLSA